MAKQVSLTWRERLHQVIYESNTPAGKAFDISLLVLIVASIIVVMLDSVQSYSRYSNLFNILEWTFTIIFTIEFILRLICIQKPLKYATSFLGIIDMLAIIFD